MDLRKVILLLVVIGAIHADGSGSDLVIKMLTHLQDHLNYLEDLIVSNEAECRTAKENAIDLKTSLTNQVQEVADENRSLREYVEQQMLYNRCTCNYSPAEPTTTPAPPTNLQDCQQLVEMGFTTDGVYTISVNGSSVNVYCMDQGWTVLVKRNNGALDFAQNFESYTNGFGEAHREYWIGLNTMHHLTTANGSWTVRFDLEAYDGSIGWAAYDDFSISEGTDFIFNYDKRSYRGPAGHRINMYTGANKFTARDMIQHPENRDRYGRKRNCADGFGGGGWWYGRYCTQTIFTGMPYGANADINWGVWKDHDVKAVTMRIKRN